MKDTKFKVKPKEKNLGGRPTKCTPEHCEPLLKFIEAGVPFTIAAPACGIHKDSIQEWNNRGQRDILNGDCATPFAMFSVAFKLIQANKIAKLRNEIELGLPGWQGKAWLLERGELNKFFGANSALYDLDKKIERLERVSESIGNK